MKALFEHIPGNDPVKAYLCNMVEKQAIGNSLLFAGPQEASKDQFAIAFAKLLMGEAAHKKIEEGNHPDLHIYRPEGKLAMHSIASMRQFCEEVYMPPYESRWKIFIIHDADRMLSYSANALLKTFEEPSLDSVIILLSDNPTMLLPTVLSRCRTIRFQPVSKKQIKDENPVRSEVLKLLSAGKMRTYTELSKAASSLADQIEQMQKNEEESIKSEIQKMANDQMNATQRNAVEKEIEGALSVKMNQHAKSLLLNILSWYRDLHLLNAKGRSELLENSDYRESLEKSLQKDALISLEVVEKSVKAAKTSLERSTALNLCLERLFLELQLI